VRFPLAFIAILIALTGPVLAEDRLPTLSTAGQGKISAAPDIAIVTLGVVSRAGSARAALNANNADMERLIAAIRAESVADKDIATTGFSISPIYSQPPRPQPGEAAIEPKIVAYQVSNQLRTVLRDLAATGRVLDKAVSAGANQAASIHFDIDNRKALLDEAIILAIGDARRKAELMAEAAGVRLVRILNVSTNQGGSGPRREAVAFSVQAVPVMGGELAISASVTIEWEIAPQ
jgi:uncharacterized protein